MMLNSVRCGKLLYKQTRFSGLGGLKVFQPQNKVFWGLRSTVSLFSTTSEQNESAATAHYDDDGCQIPKMEDATRMPRKFRELSNDMIFQLAIHGQRGAAKERLVREIMRVDNVDWPTAREKVAEMNRENDRYAWIARMPYVIGIFTGFSAGLASLPLVFHKETVIYFAREIVKMDPSEIPVDEMTTFWSVGSFSWGWMEPLLGTLSFVLLCAQLSRAQLIAAKWHPFGDWVLKKRAARLIRLYPQYNKNVVGDFAITDSWDN